MNSPVLKLRDHLGLSQTEMAEYLGYTSARISQIETGAFPPGAQFVSALWKKYRKPLEKLKISPLDVLNWKRPAA